VLVDNKNIIQKITTLLFLLFIFGVGVMTAITSAKTIVANTHLYKRDLPANPSIIDRVKTIIKTGENSIAENVWESGDLAAVDANLQYFLTKRIVSRQVLGGLDNWLFYKSTTDGNSINDYQGKERFTSDELTTIYNNLIAAKEALKAMGIRFVVMIVPNKERIYSNYMPDTIPIINRVNRTDALVAFLESKGFTDIVYPKNEFLKYRDNHQIYFKYDTHWNALGSFIGEQQLLDMLYGKRAYIENQSIKITGTCSGDLARIIHMTAYFDDDPVFTILPPTKDLSDGSHSNNNAQHSDSMLFVGDSFRNGLKPYLGHDFKHLFIVARESYSPGIIKEVKPAVVVLEFAERYSGSMVSFRLLNDK